MNVAFSKLERTYTGLELRPHFLLSELGMKGSALAAFIGPCDVQTKDLLDWEDRIQNHTIRARQMVHFIGEFFGCTLREGVLLQRLFISIILELTNKILESRRWPGEGLTRRGNDLFVGSSKLSVSIATVSSVSQLLHIGINIDPEGAPVEAIGLTTLGIQFEAWVPEILEAFKRESEEIQWACTKVRPV